MGDAMTMTAPQELVDRMFPYGLPSSEAQFPWRAARIGKSGKIEIVEAPTGTPMFGMVEEQLLARARTSGTFTDRPEDWEHLAYTDIRRPKRTKPLNDPTRGQVQRDFFQM